MPGFYFFVEADIVDESEGRICTERLADSPLAYLFDGRDRCPDQVTSHRGPGPGGKTGAVLYPKPIHGGPTLPRCFYCEEGQEWMQFEDIWIGRETRMPLPTPDDLAKREMLPGRIVIDAAGREWTVPTCYADDDRDVNLPRVYGFNNKGEYRATFKSNYRSLWDLAGDVASHFGEAITMTEEELMRAAIAFLQVNYYVGPPDVYAMAQWGCEFFQVEFLSSILGVASGWSLVKEYSQKKTV